MVTSEQATTYEVDIEDVEYLRHGDTPLLARLFRPRGRGPFPIMVELHGGAWCVETASMRTSPTKPWPATA